jgi:hypothetical protein
MIVRLDHNVIVRFFMNRIIKRVKVRVSIRVIVVLSLLLIVNLRIRVTHWLFT